MQKLAKIISWVLALSTAYMIFDGALIFFRTSGLVQGTEFGMLITLPNQLGLIMIWLALFALLSLLSPKSNG